MSEESPLERWSRRKRAARDERTRSIDAERADADGTEAPPALAEAPETEEAYLARLGLEPPERLGPAGDFRAYVAKDTPALLRRRALALLWRKNPTLANLDGLLEYGEDYRAAAMTPAVVETAYRVGRGFLREVAAEEEPQEEAALAADEPEPAGAAEQKTDAAPEAEAVVAHAAKKPESACDYRPKRMYFTTD